ncbi:MAG: dynamin family protein [Acetobacter sp.]|nr:dynamin family protein [Acetobacter sp.]
MQKNVKQEKISLKQRFEQKLTEWDNRVTTIRKLTSKIEKILSKDLTEEQRYEMQGGLDKLGQAFAVFREHADHPELTLATTGTTSSGKSTLANFLIGESVLPSAVQEMSAGLVRVKHSNKRRLTIPQTQGATWETGTWENPSANEVSKRLAETMDAFRKEEESGEELEPVIFDVEWPIRLVERKGKLDLPEGTQFTILDLPGLKSVNDERNGPVIRKNIAKAFCLVAYNAEETDRTKQKILLNEVVNQVIALSYGEGGGEHAESCVGNVSLLQRMLFLLNRVDAFYRHDDASEQLEKFKGEVTTQLRGKLEEAFPEHESAIEKIELTQVCSLPALLAVEVDRLWEDPENQDKVLKKIKRLFQQIFPEDYFDEFPRKLEELTNEQKKEFITQTFKSSYGSTFEESLSSHISESFFELVLDVPLRELSEACAQLVQILDIHVEEYTQRSAEEAEEKLRCLGRARTDLESNVCQIFGIYERVCAVIGNTGEKMETRFGDLRAPCFELGDYIGMPDVLLPLIDAMDDVLYEPRRDLLLYVSEFMEGGMPAPAPLMVGLKELDAFNEAIERLKKSPYHRYYKEGATFLEGENDAVESALVAFMPELSRIAVAVIQKALNVSSHRIQEAFAICSDKAFAKMKDIIGKETTLFTDFPGLRTIFEGEITYAPPPSMDVTISYSADQETKVFTRTEEVPTNFLRKWLFGRRIKEVREEKKVIKVPSLGELFRDFGGESDKSVAAEVNKLLTYISDSLLDPFMEELTGRINKGVHAYQKAIGASIGTITEETEKKNMLLEDYKKRIVESLSEKSEENT